MLIVLVHNDGTGTTECANYNYEVKVTETSTRLKRIAVGWVEGHEREQGWRGLLRRIVDDMDTLHIVQ